MNHVTTARRILLQEYKLLNCPKSQSVVDTSQHEMGSDEEMEYDTDGIRGKPNTIMSNVASRLHKPTITLMKGDVDKSSQSTSKLILGERIDNNGYDANDRITSNVEDLSFGCHETTFTMKKSSKELDTSTSLVNHRNERKSVRRSAASILPKQRPVYWKGKRIK
jgi:hypothetical protein